jgi:hypothetical protein
MMPYCDNLQTCGPSQESALFATCQVALVCNYLGIQDTPHKRHFPALYPGTWAGIMTFTADGGLFGTISQERWNKTKEIFSKLWNGLENQGGCFSHTDLLSDSFF